MIAKMNLQTWWNFWESARPNVLKTSNHIQVFYVWLITSETIAQDSQYPLDPQGEIEDNNGYIEDHDDKKDNTD